MKYINTLFAMPSLISGAARVLDLGSTMDSDDIPDNDLKSDYEALSQDWLSVGADINGVLDNYKEEQ